MICSLKKGGPRIIESDSNEKIVYMGLLRKIQSALVNHAIRTPMESRPGVRSKVDHGQKMKKKFAQTTQFGHPRTVDPRKASQLSGIK